MGFGFLNRLESNAGWIKIKGSNLLEYCLMSVQLTARLNKFRLIALFLCTVLIVLAVRVVQSRFYAKAGLSVSNAETVNDSMFMGLRHVPAAEVRQTLPDAAGKPAVLYFSSRLCHDCQRMLPVVSQVMSHYPALYFKKLDVLEDQSKAPAIFRAFKPVSVPMVVLINAQGEIRNVLYDYQKPELLTSAINKI